MEHTHQRQELAASEETFCFRKALLEIDLEQAVLHNDEETLHLFYRIFSSGALDATLDAFFEEERDDLIGFLKEERRSIAAAVEGGRKSDAYAIAVPLYGQLFPGSNLVRTADGRTTSGSSVVFRPFVKSAPVREFDQCDIFTYLWTKGAELEADPEEHILAAVNQDRTKERLLSLKILDMTPGFGNVATRLTEAVAYLSFLFPYREKRAFIAEWENEGLLHKFILSHVLYGVERRPFPLDVLQNCLLSRFNAQGANYRLGNPLLGMSLRELFGLPEDRGRSGLFSRDPGNLVAKLKEMHRMQSTLSDRIKEDAVVKGEIERSFHLLRQRLGEIMDLMTASYFEKSLEVKNIDELAHHIDGDEEIWGEARSSGWYGVAREMAQKMRFFHMEIEFPFLLNGGFDLIFIQPALNYLWDEELPAAEMAKAYIKRAMAYLNQTGIIVLWGPDLDKLVPELKKSRRYEVEPRGNCVLVRRQPS